MSYNILNLPKSTTKSGSSLTYVYLSDGTRASTPTLNTSNRYRYAGKENQKVGSVDLALLDFGARYYDPYVCSWTSVDPMAEKYPGMSPYNYCNVDPINRFDPDGMSTYVFQNGVGKYVVTKEGNVKDGDNNVYVGYYDSNGNWQKTSIVLGQTLTPYSFYNSDLNAWEEGTIIDLFDISGEMMMAYLTTSDITLFDYMKDARSGGIYDFKVTNRFAPNTDIGGYDSYRGMPLFVNGHSYIASARDIGNFAAGYMARANGVPYWMARIGFDMYQSLQATGKANYVANVSYGYYEPLLKIEVEGQSTKFAQKAGWLTTEW